MQRGKPLTMEDLKSLPYNLAVLKETMRLYPPAYIIGRRALKDVVVAGERPGETLRIEKNSVVFVNVLGIHRRADAFPDPDRFDPTRFLGDREKELPRCAYLPFGAGPRVCIGNHFALMEGHLLPRHHRGKREQLDLLPGSRPIADAAARHAPSAKRGADAGEQTGRQPLSLSSSARPLPARR